MKTTIKAIAALLVALCAVPAFASATGTVTNISVNSTGVTWVSLSVSTGHASCATAGAYWMIKDETSVAGKAQFSLLASAYLTGSTVTIYGLSTCTRYSGYEDIDQVVGQ